MCCGHGGIGRRVRLRGVWETMRVRFSLAAPLELSIADTKVSAIFSFFGINTANINDLYGIFAINITVVVYISFIYKFKSLNYY